jgi:hypothetical protein
MNKETENVLNKKHVLLCVDDQLINHAYEYTKQNFCGIVCSDASEIQSNSSSLIYLCGNIEENMKKIGEIENLKYKAIYVIKDLSYNYDSYDLLLIGIGQVPINVHNVGVFFMSFFSASHEVDHFNKLEKEHKFQTLSESNKPTNAYRKGIYLSKVGDTYNELKEPNDELEFNLLRCSTNLDGPTENFREPDYEIINKVNNVASFFFEQKVELNHVLAQIYANVKQEDGHEKKAKIKEHSDKTKDMPKNALIAFCTFYKDYSSDEYLDKFKGKPDSKRSPLTKLRFRLKRPTESLVDSFDVILYPNSVFLMSLTTNKLYTHEIIPSGLPVDKLPIRMGYVIRCSKTKAIFIDGQTFIEEPSKYEGIEKLTPLYEPTDDDVKKLKELYLQENKESEIVEYGPTYFSLNKGDYLKPLL